ncbi:MAG TPA: cytidine deaminase [Rhodanobacteraceae bacterium]|nr:cytidine deaminase [Rhodanobacteraceae bacterium]
MNQADLLACARAARDNAHAPYSQFRVGAAVATRDGRVFGGCNVENAAYPLCTCAERTALCAALAAGCRPGDFAHIVVVADTEAPVSPCGACRQIMMELGGADLAVTLSNLRGDVRETTVGALLPDSFRLPEQKPGSAHGLEK